MKRMLPYLGAAAVVAVAVFLLMDPGTPTAPTEVAVMAQSETVQPDAQPGAAVAAAGEADAALIAKGYVLGDVVLGSPDAPVTMLEYASLTCPHCAAFHNNTLPTLKAEYIDTGKVKLILREVYFDQYGLWASAVARCGGVERFYAFVDVLYSKQSDWAGAKDQDAIVAEIRRIGRLGGLSQQRVDECLSDQDFISKLLRDYQANAARDGVNSTPHFIIDGDVIKGARPLEEFQQLIDKKLAG